jgi:hypothetical protein
MKIKIEKENQIFILSTIISTVVASFLSLIPVWQLIILAGIAAGVLNKKIRRGTLSGAAGILLFWIIYVIHGMITNNTYTLLDQFGALIIGSGFGWLLLLLILLLGTLFGALGGAIGSGAMILIRPRFSEFLSHKRNSEKQIDK